jgi:hypothetical protein
VYEGAISSVRQAPISGPRTIRQATRVEPLVQDYCAVGRFYRLGVWLTKFQLGLDDKLDRPSPWSLRRALAGVRELLADDLPHLLGSHRFFCGTDALRKRLVDAFCSAFIFFTLLCGGSSNRD